MSVLSSTCGGAYFHKFFFKKRRREAKRESSQSKKKKKKKKGGKEKRQNLTKKAEFWRRRRRREKRSKESNALFSLSRPHRFVFLLLLLLLLLSFDPRKLPPRTEQKTDTKFSPKKREKKKISRPKEKKKIIKIRTQSLNTSCSISTKRIPIANSPKVNRHKRTCLLGVFETESPIRAEKEIRRRSKENMLLRV